MDIFYRFSYKKYINLIVLSLRRSIVFHEYDIRYGWGVWCVWERGECMVGEEWVRVKIDWLRLVFIRSLIMEG